MSFTFQLDSFLVRQGGVSNKCLPIYFCNTYLSVKKLFFEVIFLHAFNVENGIKTRLPQNLINGNNKHLI